jgi:CBS domain-containing protein
MVCWVLEKEAGMKISRILATKGKEVISIQQDQTVREAIRMLVDHNIGSLVVLDSENRLNGIITERDMIRNLAQDEAMFSHPVHRYMTKQVITGLPQDDLESVANTLTERRIRHLPILDGPNLVGIVSIGDIVKAQRDEYRGEVDTLETQMIDDEI